ncbi:hypothetical protein TMPK1_07600 [Rhodospirillales bacterium TMPK1]|uniref:Uncharacterized protein n=1 Tax=Roseiterribacter gracilis TaxID=2812848 RepID=A0A8S8X6N7_9PROT|nr:hypothetical protein TMPK1_07600 [Rhodospirillales bacterium TMPK1]
MAGAELAAATAGITAAAIDWRGGIGWQSMLPAAAGIAKRRAIVVARGLRDTGFAGCGRNSTLPELKSNASGLFRASKLQLDAGLTRVGRQTGVVAIAQRPTYLA